MSRNRGYSNFDAEHDVAFFTLLALVMIACGFVLLFATIHTNDVSLVVDDKFWESYRETTEDYTTTELQSKETCTTNFEGERACTTIYESVQVNKIRTLCHEIRIGRTDKIYYPELKSSCYDRSDDESKGFSFKVFAHEEDANTSNIYGTDNHMYTRLYIGGAFDVKVNHLNFIKGFVDDG